jgi:hypothetical protein
MKLKVQFVNYDAVAVNALDEPVCMFTLHEWEALLCSGRLLLQFNYGKTMLAR